MEAGERSSFGTMELLIIFGYGAFFAWYLLILIGYPFHFPINETDVARRGVQLCGIVGLIVGALITLHSPASFDDNAYGTLRTAIWCGVCCLVPLDVMLGSLNISLPVPVHAAAFLVSGIAAGFFFPGWENMSSRGRIKDTLLSVGIVMIAGTLVFLMIIVFMPPVAQGVMGVFLMVCNGVFFRIVSIRRDRVPRIQKQGSKQKEAASAEEFDEDDMRGFFNHKLSVVFFCTDVPLGFCIPALYMGGDVLFYSAITAGAVAMIVFLLVLRLLKKELTFINLLRLCVGVSSVSLLICAMHSALWPVCMAALACMWFVQRMAHSSTLLKLTRVQKVYPVYLTVRGKLAGTVGFAVGFAVAAIATSIGTSHQLDVVTACIVGMLIVSTLLFFPFAQSYDKQLDVVPVVIDKQASTAEDIEHAKCAELAKRYGLSPREEEILFYIVRGRNAKFIAEKLVISESTAKTHIHNIYKKSGIHSQQKFIDIMDELV